MSRFKAIQILAWVLVLLVSPAFINADIPRLINYQGYLTDDAGQPVEDGEYQMQFRIHNDSIAYSPLWTSQPETLLVINGLFNFQLGSKENIPTWIFENDTALWLGITVGSGPEPEEITPRTRLAAAPYAFQAYHAEYAGYADSADVVLQDKLSCAGIEQGATTGSGTFTINFPITFNASPYFSAHAVILSGANAGKATQISSSTPGASNATIDIQYYDAGSWTDVGSGVQVQVSYTANEK